MPGEIQQLVALNLHFKMYFKERCYFYPRICFSLVQPMMSLTRIPEPEQLQPVVPLLMNKYLYCWVYHVLGYVGASSVAPVEAATPPMQSWVPDARTWLCAIYTGWMGLILWAVAWQGWKGRKAWTSPMLQTIALFKNSCRWVCASTGKAVNHEVCKSSVLEFWPLIWMRETWAPPPVCG